VIISSTSCLDSSFMSRICQSMSIVLLIINIAHIAINQYIDRTQHEDNIYASLQSSCTLLSSKDFSSAALSRAVVTELRREPSKFNVGC
jgi:hypothetical protein